MTDNYDIKDPAFQDNPHPAFAKLRQECPVHHSDQYGFYSVSRYALSAPE